MQVTLKFTSLQALGECLYMIGIHKPIIDYYHYTIKADLTDEQIVKAKGLGAEVLDDMSDTVVPR